MNGMIELEIKQKQNYDSMKQALPIDTNEKIILHFDVENEDKYHNEKIKVMVEFD